MNLTREPGHSSRSCRSGGNRFGVAGRLSSAGSIAARNGEGPLADGPPRAPAVRRAGEEEPASTRPPRLPGGHTATTVSFGGIARRARLPSRRGRGLRHSGGERGGRHLEQRVGMVELAGWNRRTRPYSPSYPASLMTSPRRSRSIASVSGVPPMTARSSAGTSRRMASSGPNAATRRSMTALTRLLFGPTERISPMISASGTRLLKPAAFSGR